MSHCPQCGEPTPEGARACPFCGAPLAVAARPRAPVSQTIVGVSAREVAGGGTPKPPAQPVPLPAPVPAAPPAGAPKVSRTIVGMPASALSFGAASRSPGADGGSAPRPPVQPAMPLRVGQTMVGMEPLAALQRPPGAPMPPGPGPLPAPLAGAPRPMGGTLLGVARPGIAPLAPGELEDDPVPDEPAPSPGYEPARELGATLGPGAIADLGLGPAPDRDRDRRRRRFVAAPAVPRAAVKAARRDDERASRRALALVLTAGALALGAVLVGVFWPSPPPLVARPRVDEKGREGVELTCKSCPDGTKLTIAGTTGVTASGVAVVYLPTPLSVGENPFKIDIDRPGNGRDESVRVSVPVAHRIRPDLGTLQADKPAFQILAEVPTGTTVSIDGHPMSLSGGRGVENVDITEACTGVADEMRTLSRQIPYVVTPASGPPEQGVVNVFIQIASLRLEAPVAVAPSAAAGGPAPQPLHVITDGPSFLLAGKVSKGASVLAAGRAIPVLPDGSFGQVMNVSSVGATQIEVRATMPGMAPRITQVKVRRVESLEKEAREIAAAVPPPLTFSQLAADLPGAVGKVIALTGEVSETSKQRYQTVMVLDVSAASGCPAGGACTVRLVQAGDSPAKRGDTLRVYGHVGRSFSIAGRADIPEIEVDFTLRPDGGGSKDAPRSPAPRDRK